MSLKQKVIVVPQLCGTYHASYHFFTSPIRKFGTNQPTNQPTDGHEGSEINKTSKKENIHEESLSPKGCKYGSKSYQIYICISSKARVSIFCIRNYLRDSLINLQMCNTHTAPTTYITSIRENRIPRPAAIFFNLNLFFYVDQNIRVAKNAQ